MYNTLLVQKAEGQEVMDSAAFSLDTSDQDFLAHWEDPLLMRQQKNAKGRYHLGFKENKRTVSDLKAT